MELPEKDALEVEARAKRILAEKAYNGAGKVNIIKYAKDEGFAVSEMVLPNNADGIILVNTEDENILELGTNKLIFVNSKLNERFKRFVIAHELGHYYEELEKQKESKFSCAHTLVVAHRDEFGNKEEQTLEESRMDRFAAALLMPAETFKLLVEIAPKVLHAPTEDDTNAFLADYFEVPERSVVLRRAEVCV